MPLTFRQALESCMDEIPPGRVVTCGTVAKALGDTRAARSVAAWLIDHPETANAHRVVRADGRPVAAGAAVRLGREGLSLPGGRLPSERFLDALPATGFLDGLRARQTELAAQVRERDEEKSPRIIGGVDVAYAGDRAFAVAVALEADTLDLIEISEHEMDVDFPYIPTYLAFREFPAVDAALRGLKALPDVLFVDGHGRLHPAQFGFACYVGVRLDVPTIGIAKHPLAGRPSPSAERTAGAVPVELDGQVRGYAWAPPAAHRPFYVSVGHRISLPTALALSQRATRQKYPEPLVVADRLSKERKVKKNAGRSAARRTVRRRPRAHDGDSV